LTGRATCSYLSDSVSLKRFPQAVRESYDSLVSTNQEHGIPLRAV
jgi:hypothetical protein